MTNTKKSTPGDRRSRRVGTLKVQKVPRTQAAEQPPATYSILAGRYRDRWERTCREKGLDHEASYPRGFETFKDWLGALGQLDALRDAGTIFAGPLDFRALESIYLLMREHIAVEVANLAPPPLKQNIPLLRLWVTRLPERFRWTLHNLVAHPVSEVLYQVGFEDLGNTLHDLTVPLHPQGQGRG